MRLGSRQLTPAAALDLLAFSPLDWPGKTVRLDSDSAQAHLQRSSSGQHSVAEVYHVNSALAPSNVSRILAARTDAEALRSEIVERTAASLRGTRAAGAAIPALLDRLVASARDSLGLDVFFAVELRLVLDSASYTFEPISGRWHRIGALAPDERAVLDRALRLLPASAPGTGHADVLLVIGRFGRGEALYGARGYRRTLVEAGRIAGAVLSAAREIRVAARLVTEFDDVVVNTLAMADGVDEGCVAAIELEVSDDGGR